MDDHSYYHHSPIRENFNLDDDTAGSTISDAASEKTYIEDNQDGEEEEVRDGVLDLRDVESRVSKLERLKSTRSVKEDPNLVSSL